MNIAKQIAPIVALLVVGGLAALGKLDPHIVLALIAGWFAPSPLPVTPQKDGGAS